ncbi:MAG: cytochrome c3 family protein [Candidatus Zixiibacteriota bacterium]|nr:MAG: cytochrome c3 family protein [candidate division Zixibacteria bacterium]
MKFNKQKILKRLKKIGLYLGGFVLLIAIMGFAVIEITSKPDFCVTCHYMQPFYDAWEASSHNDIPCGECHYPPGAMEKISGKFRDLNQLVKYLTNTYKRSKPWAEIEDASCLKAGCHSARTLEGAGRVQFVKVVFDHTPHLKDLRRGKKLRCTSCHSQIVQGDHITVTESTCILCHFKELGPESHMSDCVLCHDPPVKKGDNDEAIVFDHTRVMERDIGCRTCHGPMIVGDGSVPKERCYNCHWDQERNSRYDDSILMHQKHITENKIECENCHLDMQHKAPSRSDKMAADCAGCHTQAHTGQENLFAGKGGYGVHDMPDPMYESGLNCQNCHVFHTYSSEFQSKGEINIAKPESCEPCHGSGFGHLLKIWEETSNEKLNVIKNLIDKTSIEIKSSEKKPVLKKKAEIILENARHNYRLVRNGRPIHNIKYSDELLSSSYNYLAEALTLIDSDYHPPKLTASSEVVPSQCANCHTGIEERSVYVFEMQFNHGRHVISADLKCGKCHSNQRRHGELVANRDNCMNCHHQKPECGNCHQLQNDLYTGKADYIGITDPNVMLEAGLDCASCHVEDDKIIRPAGAKCVECHGEGYDEMEAGWKLAVRSSIENLELLLKDISPAGLSSSDEATMERVQDILRRLKSDGSWGVHNETEIISKLSKFESEIKEIANRQTG